MAGVSMTNAFLSNGGAYSDNPIVEEYAAPVRDANHHLVPSTFRTLRPEEQRRLIEEEALRNNVVKPKGYTVSFHYNSAVESHHFGRNHPMKPWRLTLTKELVLSYGLQYAMEMFESVPATKAELAEFHNIEYLNFLSRVKPGIDPEDGERSRFLGSADVSADCPIFDGMWNYFTLYTGASLDAARKLVSDQSDIALNWSGGLHHAHKNLGSGFCYINDIVLAIQELLTVHARVLYIDIDVHHGDGVEEAFHSTDRVLTLSFHKHSKDFFPGTGGMDETGPKDANGDMDKESPGAHHGLNVPLLDGINDDQWKDLFANITGPVIDAYNPGAILLQCGADSLGGDRLGNFNINIEAHGYCVQFVKSMSHNRKLMVVGGGGYTPRNVARCWTHETSLCVGVNLDPILPAHVPYRQAFEGEEHGNGKMYPKLDNIPGKIHPNTHSPEYLENLKRSIHEQLRYIQGAPSVQMQRIPNGYMRVRQEEDERLRDQANEANIGRKRLERGIGVIGEYH